MNIKEITYTFRLSITKSHLKDPFNLYIDSKEKKVITVNQKIKIVAISIFVGLLTLGIGGIVTFYTLTAHAKIKKLQAAELHIQDILKPKFIKSTSITYNFSGGRFGDNIMVYLAAKWLEYKKGYKIYYKPFEYSEHFILDTIEEPFASNLTFNRTIKYDRPEAAQKVDETNKEASTLIVLSPFIINPDWEDPQFKAEVQKVLKPKDPLPELNLPSDRVSVALHVRRGGNYLPDHFLIKKQMPTKFPPDDFYLTGLREISKAYKGKKLYVHIFTDDPNPRAIAEAYRQKLPELDVEFNFNKEENGHNINVMKDFFSMIQFQCIVRPDSGFSHAASLAGNPEICFSPVRWGYQEKINGKIVVPGVLHDRRA